MDPTDRVFWMIVGGVIGGVITLAVTVLFRILLPRLARRLGMCIGDLKLESPYEDYARDMPSKVRFLRVPVKAWIGSLENVQAKMKLTNLDSGKEKDTPGILHWERQPRSGKPHPRKLHQDLKTGNDVVIHQVEVHFASNEPINISWLNEEHVDLLMKVESVEEVIPAINRENRLPPGKYKIDLRVSAQNAGHKDKRFEIEMGKGVEDMRPVD